jgi:hypothetical protein
MRLMSRGLTRRALQCALVAISLTSQALSGQGPSSATEDPFQRVRFLIGRWEGTTEGQPGKGTISREYSTALNARFIRVKNRSTYPPQAANAKGEVHDDEAFISFDRSRKKLVLRQFHVEGFVNQYAEDAGTTADRLSLTSEQIENIPSGWRARETYIKRGPDAFEEIFELAEPGKSFEVYSHARFFRVP